MMNLLPPNRSQFRSPNGHLAPARPAGIATPLLESEHLPGGFAAVPRLGVFPSTSGKPIDQTPPSVP